MQGINVMLEDENKEFLDEFKKVHKCKNLDETLNKALKTLQEQLK